MPPPLPPAELTAPAARHVHTPPVPTTTGSDLPPTPFCDVVLHQLLVGVPAEVPATPSPAVAATRRNDTLLDVLTNTAMLDPPASVADRATNAMSSKCAPVVRRSTSSANPVVLGATVAAIPLYDHGPVPLSGVPASRT